MIDGEKLRLVREERGISVMELGRRLGWEGNPSYLYLIQNGRHEATFKLLKEIPTALETEPWRIMRDDVIVAATGARPGMVGEGRWFYQAGLLTIPIVGYASAGDASAPEYTNGNTPPGIGVLGEIDPGQDFGPGAYAIRVRGDSMLPRFRNGNILIVSPGARWGDGDTCLVRHVDGHVWIKRLSAHDSTWCLESDNPAYPTILLRQSELAYVHRVTAALLR